MACSTESTPHRYDSEQTASLVDTSLAFYRGVVRGGSVEAAIDPQSGANPAPSFFISNGSTSLPWCRPFPVRQVVLGWDDLLAF